MFKNMRSRTIAAGVTLTLVTTGLAAVLPGGVAHASGLFASAPSVQVGYTDSAAPSRAFPWAEGVHLPLGARAAADGRVHRSRVYATYDLSAFVGKHVLGGTVRAQEQTVADCTKRAVELWQTRTVTTTPSWASAPAELSKLDDVLTAPTCAPAMLAFDATSAVTDALAQGRTKITFELRVPAAVESSTAYGRTLNWYNTVQLTVEYNSLPTVSAKNLFNSYLPCDRSAPYQFISGPQVLLQAMVDDPDGSLNLTGEFAIWPATDPTARTVITRDSANPGSVNTVTVPDGVITDGGTYAWQVRAMDGIDATAWTKPCLFTVDSTRPAAAPGVTSPNYPQDTGELLPGGVPATFVFTAGGVADVLAYQYRWNDNTFPVFGCSLGDHGVPACPDWTKSPDVVLADQLGGSATVALSPPRYGINTLYVRSLDRAGLSSPTRGYGFLVADTSPLVTANPAQPALGEPVTLTFAPGANVTRVQKYTYAVNGGTTKTVRARADGTARVTVTLTASGSNTVSVRSYSANGWVSPDAQWSVYFDTTPRISSTDYPENETSGGTGVTGTFRFDPAMPNVADYTYDFGDGSHTVAAGPDGSATVEFTPDRAGFYILQVTARSASGLVSSPAYYFFDVVDNTPLVDGPFDAKVGVAKDYHVTPQNGAATAFAYSFYENTTGWTDERTVPAAADGTATVSFAPTESGYFQIKVVSVYANGSRSGPGYFSTYAESNAPFLNAVTIGYPGTPAEFVVGPNAEGVVGYVYQINDGPELTVPASADGTATITFTPSEPGSLHFVVRSRQADGSRSLPNDNYFYVPEPPAPDPEV
jgi:hypothetical protein